MNSVHRALLATLVMAVLPASAAAQQAIVPFTSIAAVDNRVRVGGTEIERASGSVWGIGATARFSPWLGGRIRLAGGTLTGRSPATEDRGYAQADIAVVLTPETWATVDVAAVTRVLEGSVARQRWVELRLGSEAKIRLLDEVLRAAVRLSVAPGVSVTGQPSPDLALGVGTGLEYVGRQFIAGLDYDFDRYDFPPGPTGRRLEQRAAVTARVGWRFR